MSGQLVGEVLAASDELRRRGLSQRAFYALIAIAEKAQTDSRQGSVRWDHICAALYGASKRTAERAVQDLRSAGLVRVIRPGFNNNRGQRAAPICEVQQIRSGNDADTQVTASVATDTDTQVTRSVSTDADTRVTASTPTDTDKSATDTDKSATDTDTLGVVLDGSIDGSNDGVRAREHSNGSPHADPHPQHLANGNRTWIRGAYGPRCRRHLNDPDPPDCVPCGRARIADEAERRAEADRVAAEQTAIRRAIDRCPDCDDFGRLDDLMDCPQHPNFRRAPARSTC